MIGQPDVLPSPCRRDQGTHYKIKLHCREAPPCGRGDSNSDASKEHQNEQAKMAKQETFIFQLDEKPPFFRNLIYGLQWVTIAIPSVVIFSTLCSTALGLNPAAQVSFSQRLLIVMGLATILQSLKGHRYPISEGPSSALLLSFMSPPQGLPVIEGGLIFGGLFLMAAGRFKWFRWFSSLFTSNVVGVVLILVSFNLLPFVYSMLIGINPSHPYGDVTVCGFSLLIILFVSFLSHWLRGFFQTTSMLAGIIFGLILFLLQGEVHFGVVRESAWLALPSPSLGMAGLLSSSHSFDSLYKPGGHDQYRRQHPRHVGNRFERRSRGSDPPGYLRDGCRRFDCSTSGGYWPGKCLHQYRGCRGFPGRQSLCADHERSNDDRLCLCPQAVGRSDVNSFACYRCRAFRIPFIPIDGRHERHHVQEERDRAKRLFHRGLPNSFSGTIISILPKQFFGFFPGTIASVISNGLVMGLIFSLFLEHLLFRPRKK